MLICGSLADLFLPQPPGEESDLHLLKVCSQMAKVEGVPLASVRAPPGIVGESKQELDPWSLRDSRTGIFELGPSFTQSWATFLVPTKGHGGTDRSWYEAQSLMQDFG